MGAQELDIARIAVIGSGVMGAGIAAHVANAGIPVLLLDLPSEGEDRSRIAREALERLKKADPAPLMHPRNARLITPGNLEDDLARLGEVDWIVEAVLERLDVKQSLYERIDAVRRPGTVVSSNTSTIPLRRLVEPFPEGFRRDFLITHFFNPPRYMRLLELVAGAGTRPEVTEGIARFCDVRLGKGVVRAKDTPGFIANRIGALWMQTGVLEAIRLRLTVEVADAVISGPFGIPRTGIFGLLDLIGLDLMPHIMGSLQALLPPDDPLQGVSEVPPIIERMLAQGLTGRKGKGGFYRRVREDGRSRREVIDLASGEYRPAQRPRRESIEVARRDGLRAFLELDTPEAAYAWNVMSATLAYSASLVPEIADDIVGVDQAMRLGYRWEKGPFELIDALGTQWFAERLRAEGREVPALLERVAPKTFYQTSGPRREYFGTDGRYRPIVRPEGVLLLEDIRRAGPPVAANASASLWDIGEGVVCLEFHTRMNALDAGTIAMLERAVEMLGDRYRGLVIYNEGENFSVGANAGLILYAANLAMWDFIEMGLAGGQNALRALRDVACPVVGAPSGMALGGGCEVLLHCDAVQAHAETYAGLVEVGVGLIPGWGGCKEMLARNLANPRRPGGPMPAIQKAFETISLARVSRSAEEAKDHLFLGPDDRITMNRDRLLWDARARVLELAEGYTPRPAPEFRLPGPSGRLALELAIDGFRAQGLATPHDAVVARELARVLTGGDTDITQTLSEDDVLALEREAFLRLVRTPGTLARLEHMLETGRALRN